MVEQARVKRGKIPTINKRKLYGFKLFLLILPFLVLTFIFSYYPLWGWVYSLFDYRPPRPLSKCEFVGLKWFISLVDNKTKRDLIFQVMTNTFAMSGLSIITSWLPMMFAIFLSELKLKSFKKVVQTLTTLPNFISWILVYSLAFSMFSNNGLVNELLIQLGVLKQPILFLNSNDHVWLTMWLWQTWKGLGWGAILYLAGISGIDQELYEAAKVDGANRMKLIKHITLPSLLPTYFVLLMLNIANFLNNGMEQYFVFQNAFNMQHIQVLDLYVYNLAVGSGSYSMATAIGILKSFVSVTLLVTVNGLSKKFRGDTII